MPTKHAKQAFFIMAISAWNISFAQESRIYYLQKNETISEILYLRLQISPIYGKKNPLNKVLEFNNLTLKEAKMLPEGRAIKIPLSLFPTPDFTTKKDPEIEPIQTENTEKTPPQPLVIEEIKIQKSFVLIKPGFFTYSGQANQGARFFIRAPYITTSYLKNFRSSDWSTSLDGSFQLTCIKCGIENKIYPSFFFNGSYRKNFSDTFSMGPGLSISRDFFIQQESEQEKIAYGVVPSIFLHLENASEHYTFWIKLGKSIPIQIENKKKLKSTFGSLIALKKMDSWSFGFEVSQDFKEIAGYDQTSSKFTFITKWNFD